MELVTRVQILDKAVCISFCANAPRKGGSLMFSFQLCLSRTDWVLWYLLGKHLKRKTEFKPIVLCLKIDLVSPPTCGRGVG